MQVLRIINLLIINLLIVQKNPCDTKLMKRTDMDVHVLEPKKASMNSKDM